MKHNFSILVGLFIMILTCAHTTIAQSKKFKLPEQLNEASGLYVASPDKLYWLNDSGNPAALYLTDGTGNLLKTINLPIRNIDWEDLTHDDQGNIYLGDFGNNRNNRRDLRIYIYTVANEKLDSITFHYPDQKNFPPKREDRNFDMEGFVWYKDSLHLFSKNKVGAGNYYTKHYSLAAQTGEQSLLLRDSISLKNRVVTGAAMSPDNQVLTLLTYDYRKHIGLFPKAKVSVFTFENFSNSDFFTADCHQQKLHFLSPAHQFEAIDFLDNKNIIVASERIVFFKQQAKVIKLKRKSVSLP